MTKWWMNIWHNDERLNKEWRWSNIWQKRWITKSRMVMSNYMETDPEWLCVYDDVSNYLILRLRSIIMILQMILRMHIRLRNVSIPLTFRMLNCGITY